MVSTMAETSVRMAETPMHFLIFFLSCAPKYRAIGMDRPRVALFKKPIRVLEITLVAPTAASASGLIQFPTIAESQKL